jgi:hydrogenase maturation protein HypF
MAQEVFHRELTVPIDSPCTILAVGAELKSSLCRLVGNRAELTDALGHLAAPDVYRRFLALAGPLVEALPPEGVLACDAHPGYAASQFARRSGRAVVAVQHHRAHLAAAMAENGLACPTLGVVADGTGYGDDGAVWGCEIFAAESFARIDRVASLLPFGLIGGDRAAIDTWRPAAGLCVAAFDEPWPEAVRRLFADLDAEAVALSAQRLRAGRGIETSSLGRLFDAAAFLLGLCEANETEAAAPMAVQAAAERFGPAEAFDAPWDRTASPARLDCRPMVRELIARRDAGSEVDQLAAAFHETIAQSLAGEVVRQAELRQCDQVVLSGGCFLNRVLAGRLAELLGSGGLRVYTHKVLSPGDACVALGQALLAAAEYNTTNTRVS